MADPLAPWMWRSLTEPQRRVDHVIVNADMIGRAPEVETILLPASSADDLSDVQQQGTVDVPQDEKPGHGGPVTLEEVGHEIVAEEIEGEMQTALSNWDQPLRDGKEHPWIWRVHPSVREQESEAYEPKLVSIGPLHHGNPRLKPMEAVKLRYLEHLIMRSPKTNNLRNYTQVIRACEPRARKQYPDGQFELSANDFVKVLVVDGCFIIENLLRRFFGERQDTDLLFGVGWSLSHLRRDLMLLENQIPFFVLMELFKCSTISTPGTSPQDYSPSTLMQIVLHFLRIELPREEHPEADIDEVYHLLQLYYRCLNQPPRRYTSPSLRRGPSVVYPMIKMASLATSLMSQAFFGLLYLLLINEWPWSTKDSELKRTIPCATDLHNFGVKFQRKVYGDVNPFLGVLFNKEEGTLEIPFFPVQQSTSSQLRNFIALEHCHPELGNSFTCYAILMENIINNKNDVAILRKNRIIENMLGSDKQVAVMFKSLLKGTHVNYTQQPRIPDLFKDVKAYCDVPQHRWRASLKSTQLRSPWSTISLVIGTMAFAITITQAYFTITRSPQRY